MIVDINNIPPLSSYVDDVYVINSSIWAENVFLSEYKLNKQENDMNKEDVLKTSLTVYERDILELADDMASAMTDLNAHNYRNFVEARDRFRDKLKEMCDHTLSNYEKVERMKKMVAEL